MKLLFPYFTHAEFCTKMVHLFVRRYGSKIYATEAYFGCLCIVKESYFRDIQTILVYLGAAFLLSVFCLVLCDKCWDCLTFFHVYRSISELFEKRKYLDYKWDGR